MSTIRQMEITSADGVTLATKGKYCPNTLRVSPRLATLTVTANGTYPIPDGFAGYDAVTVAVSEAGIACRHESTNTAVLREPSCTEAGTAKISCRACGATWSQILPRLSHRDSVTVVPPTCERGGYTLHTCALCGRSYTDTETAPLGHAFGQPEPDEAFSSGYSVTCSRCGAKEEASP